MATRAPSLSNSCAAASPIPLLPPVIRIFLSASLPMVVPPMMFKPCRGLHLREAAVHKQFRPRDVAAVVGSEKNDGLGDLIGRAEPAERNTAGKHLQALLARGLHQALQSGSLDGAWADHVHANPSILQVGCPGPRERTHGGLGGAGNAIRPKPLAGADGGVQDD